MCVLTHTISRIRILLKKKNKKEEEQNLKRGKIHKATHKSMCSSRR